MKTGLEGALSMLGLARRGGRVVSGDRAVLAACKSGQAQVILLARDASENTRRRFREAAARAGVAVQEVGDKVRFGEALGQSPRAVVAVTHRGFAKAVVERLASQPAGRPGGGEESLESD
ncbi:L7Ae/L30e/S12e/Gadd45 family ribosomal protein [Limnochorda pilosa]|uniref:50S ribosomal protein L7/L12 n=1 Tax=Limnochorda pilosa TaxID=1555112 RepID=A0A0K2SK94_LIMPI|nr:ribosomal L7Ae/L30e/S12e/Gadd45 family protein [Limnochorda pilosa]BAS27536.1 50S ribosomal protein L7/L12 [Limnochorda pilosa]